MSLLTWKEYRTGKRIEGVVCGKQTASETPVETPNLEVAQLNGMTSEDLQEIKGIGPKTAEKIVSGQPYTEVDDLAEVVSEPLLRRVRETLSENA